MITFCKSWYFCTIFWSAFSLLDTGKYQMWRSDSEHGIPIRAMFSWHPFQGQFKVQQIILKQHDVWCQKQGFINFQRIWLLFVLANQNVGNPVSFMWINAQIKKELFRRINVHFNLSMHLVSQTSKTIVKYVITSIGKCQKAFSYMTYNSQ